MNVIISQQNAMINNQNETIGEMNTIMYNQQVLLNNICSNNPELCAQEIYSL